MGVLLVLESERQIALKEVDVSKGDRIESIVGLYLEISEKSIRPDSRQRYRACVCEIVICIG